MRSNLNLFLAAVGTGVVLGGAGAMVHGPAHHAPAAPVAAAAPAPAAVTTTLNAARAVLGAAGIESGAQSAQVKSALAALAGEVKKESDPKALKMAFQAYFSFKSAHPDEVKKPYLYFVDYGLDSREPRGYVFDMVSLKVVDGPFTVAHGRGSGAPAGGVPTRFSNKNGSAASSLGLFLTQETYAFTGHTGGKAYRSIGLRLKGLSGKFNDDARARGVVVHGAPYVTDSKAGRSEGCPAMEPARARELVPEIANGGLVFLFSPNDPQWVDGDPWANATGASAAMNG